MNSNPGVIGRKVGMTQVLDADGTVIPCTVVRSDAIVVAKRTEDKDGYNAIIAGIDERKEKHTSKPLAGFYKKAGVDAKRELRELRCTAEYAAAQEVGSSLKLDGIFDEGQFVDVQATSKGKGFAGVMKRYNFRGAIRTHGVHEFFRHGGSIGTRLTPGMVLKGKKMPGHMGARRVTVQNLHVARVDPERNLVYVRGGVPGPNGALVSVRKAVKA